MRAPTRSGRIGGHISPSRWPLRLTRDSTPPTPRLGHPFRPREILHPARVIPLAFLTVIALGTLLLSQPLATGSG